MAQKKKKGTANKKSTSKKNTGWRVRHEKMPVRLIAIIVLAGLLCAALGFYVQSKGWLAVNDGEQQAESPLRLNEVMAENISTLVTETGDVPDWVEIINTGKEPVEIGKYSLMVDTSVNRMFTFPDYTMQPGECLVLYAGGMENTKDSHWNMPFKLSASGGQNLILMNPASKAVDVVELPELTEDQAYCRRADGSWEIGRATPGADNDSEGMSAAQDSGLQVVPGALVLSEAMASNNFYFADENGEFHDYVEIHNTSSSDVNLKGWYLADSSDSLKDWAFPDVRIPAGGYLAVHCSGLNRREDPNHLHTDFKIGSNGECIYLTRPDGQTVSTLELPALADDQAYSLVNGMWSSENAPTPGMENTAEAAGGAHAAAFGDRSGSVYISEIMAVPTEQEYDWIEIYNGSGQAVDLSNYGLSDDSRKPRKWQFPQGTIIQPGEYMGVFLSGKEVSTLGGFLNADFALAAEGNYTVTLAEPDGKVIDAVYLTNQYGGVSYGRSRGEAGFFLFEQGTPGAANTGNHYRGRATEAQASVQGGLFTSGDSFTVELSAPAGDQIYYTLDCSDPDQGSTPYNGPITVSSTTILRTRVYRNGYMPSAVDTQSYLYDVNNEGSVYVVSVVSDPDNLYSDETGIMVMGKNPWPKEPYGKINQGANFWMDWEREGHVELFEADGDPAISQRCGLKMHGQYSRYQAVKAFKVMARNEYGDNRFDYPIFSERDYDSYQSFLLRVSGQDFDKTFMRDSVLSALANDTSVLYQETEVGVCYLNGEYYSLVNLRERVSKFSICQFEDWEGMEDDIDLIKANDIEKIGSNATFEDLLAKVKKYDMTTQAAYDYLDSQIDIQNYIEYMTMQIFVGNGDTLNVKRYRNAQDDGKWRWVLFDLDWAFHVDTNSIGRWLTPGGMGTNKYTDNTLFIAAMKNPIFYDRFLTYIGERMGTVLTSENIMEKFMERYAIIDGLLPQYIEKYNFNERLMKQEMGKLYNYIETRPTKLLGYFQESLKLSDAEMKKYFGKAIEAIQDYAAKTASGTQAE